MLEIHSYNVPMGKNLNGLKFFLGFFITFFNLAVKGDLHIKKLELFLKVIYLKCGCKAGGF